MRNVPLLAALVGTTLAALPTAASATLEDPPIRITLNKRGVLERGDRVRAFIRTAEDGYVLVLHAEPDGRIRVLFPLDPFYDDYVRGGDKLEIRGRGDREAFRVLERDGVGTVFAAYSRDPFTLGAFILADHWDYRALDEWRITGDRDPEGELIALAQEITGQTFFEYDVLQYGVGVSYTAYRNTVFQFSAGLGWGWSPYYWGRPGFALSWGIDPWYPRYYWASHRRWASLHFCDGFFYDPWACSLAYTYGGLWNDPFWYSGYYGYWNSPTYWDYYGYAPYGSAYAYRQRDRVRYTSTRFGPAALGGGKYTFKSGVQSGLTGGVGMRQRAPEGYRLAEGRRGLASPAAPTAAGRRVSAPTSTTRTVSSPTATTRRTVAQPRTVQPGGWGITNGRRVVEATGNSGTPAQNDSPAPRRATGGATTQAGSSPARAGTVRVVPGQQAGEERRRETSDPGPSVRRPASSTAATPATPRRVTNPDAGTQPQRATTRPRPATVRQPAQATPSPRPAAARQPARTPTRVTPTRVPRPSASSARTPSRPARATTSAPRSAPRPVARASTPPQRASSPARAAPRRPKP